jgi:soluble lytic murein transglycosylase
MIRFAHRHFFLSLGVFALILGCHSLPARSPSDSSLESSWISDYKWARKTENTHSEKACAIFRTLSADSKFPVHEMALLRAVEYCPVDTFKDFSRSALPTWLQPMALDILLKQKATQGDKAGELDLALEKSKERLPQAEKLKWINLAIQDAQASGKTDQIEDLQSRLYAIAPRLNSTPSDKQFLSVASDFRMNRKFSDARDYYEKIIKSDSSTDDEKISAFKGIRLTYKNARDNTAHLAASQRLVDFLKAAVKHHTRAANLQVAYYEAQIYLARAQWNLEQTSVAKKTFADIAKHMKDKVSLAELFWLQARMAEEEHDLAQVTSLLDLALKEKITDLDLRDKILWYSAWNQRRAHNWTVAIQQLTDLEQKASSDGVRIRAAFWLGKTLNDNHQTDEAQNTFQGLLEADSLGYYGLLAHRELKQAITLPPPAAEVVGVESTPPFDIKIAEWLSNLDEREALAAFLDHTSANYRRSKEQNSAEWVLLFKAYAKAGLYSKLFEYLNGLSTDQRKEISQAHADLMFPQPWSAEVDASANQFGVERSLIYAIIRQESAFDPRARSLADAFGPMQLLPEVAEVLSRRFRVPYTTMEDLYDPKTNIALGAAQLNELLERNHRQFITTVAGYNASEAVVRNWLKNRYHSDALEFIEDIPYEETRSYVRLVMRNLIFYSLLQAKSGKVDFPEQVLEITVPTS